MESHESHRDPAPDAAHPHQHGHRHHSRHASTTNHRSIVPDPGPHHHIAAYAHPGAGPLIHTATKDLDEKLRDDGGKKPTCSIDVEQGNASPPSASAVSPESGKHAKRAFSPRYRPLCHFLMWFLATAWWVAGLVLHHADMNWIVPFLIWLAVTIRFLTFYVPVSVVTRPMHWTWNNTGVRINNMIPENLRLYCGAAVSVAVILIGTFVSAESADNTRENRAISLFGMVVLIAGLWATSRNRKAINWHTVISGFLIQYVVALFVLRTRAGYDIFNFISGLARSLLGFAGAGVAFLTAQTIVDTIHWFLLSVLPAIIFFVSIVQLLYYVGLLQWLIGKFAVFFFWSMRVSGAEAVVAAASPFIGQGESAMLIKPFVAHLTMCELHQVMTSGFATIAGSVLVAYIGMGVNPQALISSCVMSIPASLAASKLRYPEEDKSLTAGKFVVPDDDDDHKAANALHAFANGAWLGLKIAGMILTTLLCIIAFVALINGILTWLGHYINLTGDHELTIELILGYLCYPIAFLLGVPRGPDLIKVARLIGIKVVTNEFVAYNALTTEPAYATLSPRSKLIATYSLCGFGNLGSLGTQIGVLSQIAPGRSGDVSRIALSALITGVLSTLSSASIAGLVIQNEAAFS